MGVDPRSPRYSGRGVLLPPQPPIVYDQFTELAALLASIRCGLLPPPAAMGEKLKILMRIFAMAEMTYNRVQASRLDRLSSILLIRGTI